MQIKHMNPFHLVGAGIKHCKKAKQTKERSKAVFRPNPIYTLLNLLRLVFFVGIFKTSVKCFDVDQKRCATAILPVLLCVE